MKKIITPLLFGLLFAASGVNADVVMLTSRDGFYAVTKNHIVLGFEGISESSSGGGFSGTGLEVAGITFTGTGGCGDPHLDVGPPSASTTWGTGDALFGDRFGFCQSSGIPVGNIEALLPTKTYATGTDFMLVHANGTSPSEPVLFSVYTGKTRRDFQLNSIANSAAFAGFISDTPITSVQFRTLGVNGDGSSYGALDNFIIANSQGFAIKK
jgi:hypothetical protein